MPVTVIENKRHVAGCENVEGKAIPNTKQVQAATTRASCDCWAKYEEAQAAKRERAAKRANA